MSKPILYNYWRSSCSWRVRIALNLKGIDYEYKIVNLLANEHKTPEYLALNPRALVPLLDFNGHLMTESVAIMEYLDEKFPDKNPFFPKNLEDRATVRSLVTAITSNIQPVQNMRVIRYVGQGDQDKTAAFARTFIELGFESFEKDLQKTAGKYAFGDNITMADIVIPAQVYNALRFGVDMTKYPTIWRVYEELEKIPEFVKADAWHQPDTPPTERKTSDESEASVKSN